jgi:hypothetical protein
VSVYLATNKSIIDGTNCSSQVLFGRLAELLPGVDVITYPDWFGPGSPYSPDLMARNLLSVDAVIVWPRRVRTATEARDEKTTPVALSDGVLNHIRLAARAKVRVLILTPSDLVTSDSCHVSPTPMQDRTYRMSKPQVSARYELWMPHRSDRAPRLEADELIRKINAREDAYSHSR